MMNAIKLFVWTVVCTGVCLMFAADVCQINDTIAHKKEVLRLANAAQETSLLQAKHVTRLEGALTEYNKDLTQQSSQIQLLEKALETSTTQLQSLVDDNSKLEAELDTTATLLRSIEADLARTKADLEKRTKELEDLQNNG